MKKQLASEDTINRIYNSMGANTELLFLSLCTCVDSIKQLKGCVSKNSADYRTELLLTMLEIKAFVITIQLDISTFLRADFRAKHPCEKRISLKYVNVAILEGCKYMQGFGKDAKHGKLSVLEKIEQANSDNELSNDISILKNALDDFLKQCNNLIDKTNRDLALHYDQDPLKVYDFLEQISEETEVNRVIKWFDVLNSAFKITGKYIEKYESIMPKSQTDTNLVEIYKQLNIFPDEDNKVYNSTEEIISTYSNRLDSIVQNCRLPEKVAKTMDSKLQIDLDIITQSCQPLIQDIYPGIHIHYIYLDLACALKAYFTSESFAERQLNLRRITVILYDGFARIYGYNLAQQNQSFWKTIYSTLQKSEDVEITTLLTKVQTILEDLSKDQSINNPALRECFIHYRKGKDDNIIKLNEETTKAFPIAEMAKTLKLLNILPDIIKLNTASLATVNRAIENDIEEKHNENRNRLHGILDIIDDADLKQKFKVDIIDKFDDIFAKFMK